MTILKNNDLPSVEKNPNLSLVHNYPPLEAETRPVIPTANAAYYLNRESQTLRLWACLEKGPIRPIRICGRLAWSVAEIRALVKKEHV